MQSHSIRQAYLDYFKQEGHTIVDSSSLVPITIQPCCSPILGWCNLKRRLPSVRIEATRARVMSAMYSRRRKHNDLDNVGYTARHHTFFEMLAISASAIISKVKRLDSVGSF